MTTATQMIRAARRAHSIGPDVFAPRRISKARALELWRNAHQDYTGVALTQRGDDVIITVYWSVAP